MLETRYVSGTHRKSFQSLLVLSLALGCSTGTLLRASSDRNYGQIPLTFVANHGQVHHSVRFTAKGPGLTAYFTPAQVVIDLRGSVLKMRFLGSNADPDVDGGDEQQGRANYLIGDDPSQWRTNVPLYGKVVYRNLYPGVDMVYSSHKRLLKSEFVVAPGADPSRILIEYTGADNLRLDDRGGLVFTASAGDLREDAPEIYQEIGGVRRAVQGAFQLTGGLVSFSVGDYDRAQALFIDPVLSYSTYLGGAGTERAHGIAVDTTGAAYVTGYTDSTNFPVSGGVVGATSGGGVDAFVTKLNAAGSAIVYSTYLGGSGDDRGFSIAVDTSGNAFLTGYTSSTNFPLLGPMQASSGGGRDAFVAKLNTTGTAFVYSTYLGGSGSDNGSGIAIDVAGAAYITGSTSSANFPVLGSFQASLGGGQDGFAVKLNAAGSAEVYATYLGGSLDDRGSAIAVDAAGAVYIAGNTNSTNFPTLTPLQAANGGSQDGFVTKLSASGASLAYSTYLGGSGTENIEVGRSIAVDSSNSAYVTGTTASSNFPVSGALQAASNGGGNDAFVVKLTTAGTAFVYSTYLGGTGIDYGQSVAIDSAGSAHVAGYTSSVNFPGVNSDQPANGGNFDVFVSKLNASGSALSESGFLGGAGADAGYGIAVDTAGNAYITGQTFSSNFPLLGAVQSTNGTTLAAFVARFTFGPTGPPTAVSVTPSSGTAASQTFSLVYSDSRGFADIAWVEMNWNATQATAGACYLHYTRATNIVQLSNDAGSGWIGSATLGVVGTLQNSQCILDVGSSSVSGSGSILTVNLSLTFKPVFAGTKNIHMQVQDLSGTLTPWQARGTWNVIAAPPENLTVAPAAGSGATQVFSFVYSDAAGFADIKYVQVLFQTQVTGANACYLEYVRGANTINLVADSGSGYTATAQIGAAGTLTNNQCTLDNAASSVSTSGNNLTLTLALTFKPAFVGAKNTYMNVFNNANVSAGWQAKGSWTVPGGPPLANVSVTPASGSGTTQVFSFLYSDVSGFADINYVQVLFQTQVTGANACYLEYVRGANTINLVADSGSGYVASAQLGAAGTLTNSQCTLDNPASSVSTSGTNLTLTLALTFKPAFAGAKNTYMNVFNNAYSSAGWQAKGTWTVPLPPLANVSVTPASGSGATQVFSFVYSDAAGFADINYAQVLFQTQVTGANACYLEYVRGANTINLVADSGSGYAASAQIGAAGTLTNSQCTLDNAVSSVSTSGTNLTLTLALTFKPAFAGAKNTYMNVFNNANASAGWQAKGTWTVPGGPPLVNVSVTPASGSGATQVFSFVYSDVSGFADIRYVQVLFQTQVSGANACYLEYVRGDNSINLVANSGSGYAASGQLGLAGTLTNSQCTLDTGASSVSTSGNNVTLTLALTFKPAFAGAKNTYMNVFNNANLSAGWEAKGTWTVP